MTVVVMKIVEGVTWIITIVISKAVLQIILALVEMVEIMTMMTECHGATMLMIVTTSMAVETAVVKAMTTAWVTMVLLWMDHQ